MVLKIKLTKIKSAYSKKEKTHATKGKTNAGLRFLLKRDQSLAKKEKKLTQVSFRPTSRESEGFGFLFLTLNHPLVFVTGFTHKILCIYTGFSIEIQGPHKSYWVRPMLHGSSAHAVAEPEI